jgi:xanthine dehydrogenase accessory factor
VAGPASAPAPVIVRGGGELGSAAARLLFLAGLPVLVLEKPQPLAVRRLVSFAEALRSGPWPVEGVLARAAAPAETAAALAAGGAVIVVADPEGDLLRAFSPAALVDARMAKRNLGTRRDQAPVVVGLGPGFEAGADVHAVVETQRGPHLGRVLWSGTAAPDTGVPAALGGESDRRVLRAPRTGRFRGRARIGEVVGEGTVVGEVDGEPIPAGLAGRLRGLLADGVEVAAGVKVGDVDPRGAAVAADAVSDKARAVAAGVLEAVLVGSRRRAGP